MTDDDLAREMAAAVLAGDEAAAYALADLLLDCRARGLELVDRSAEDEFAVQYVIAAKESLDNPRVWQQRVPDSLVKGAARLPMKRLLLLRAALSHEPGGVRAAARLGALWALWEPCLTVQCRKVLASARVVTPREVAAKGRSWWSNVEGCGTVSLQSMEAMLARYGLRWSNP